MKLKICFLICLTILLQSYNYAQLEAAHIVQNAKNIKIAINVAEKYSIQNTSNGTKVSFYNLQDVAKPGSPTLPSKIIYVALPPESKASVQLSNQVYKTFTDNNVQINSSVVKTSDSTLKYERQSLSPQYFQTDQYPSAESKILNYTWIRNYYCAVIQINAGIYNWKLKQVKLLQSADLNISYNNNKPFPVNNSTGAPYDSILKKVIINYNEANNFRSFRKLFSAADTTGSWIDYTKQYVKLAIPADGIYKIDYNDLINYEVDPSSIDPSTIKIYCKGKELPLYIKSGQSGYFTQNDFIEFWAEKNYGSPNYRQIVPQDTDYLNYMNRYTDTTFVWLTWGGDNGHRIKINSTQNSSVNDTLDSYLNFQHFEKDVRLWYYDSVVPRVQLPFWQENKVWTWQILGTNGTIAVPFQASNILPNSKLKTYVRLISYASDVQTNAHKVGIGVNSRTIRDSITFNFKQTANLFSTLSSDVLKEGSNTLNIMDIPTSATFQQVLLDWVDVEYYRYTNAINDSLYFKFPDSLTSKPRVIKITNITLPDTSLILYKVKPDTIRFNNFTLSGGTIKTLTFTDTVKGGDAYILISKNYLKKPVFETKKQFVNLRNNPNGADDIIISNKVLLKSANDYNNFIKSSYNIRTKLAFVNDIYDEFSYGYPEPEAIKSFLLYAYNNWTSPRPSYLTLIGDANYDYKNLWSPVPAVRKQDLVPSYGYPVSDGWYSMWDSSQADIPQMFTGRIPAANDQQVYFYLDKYKKYLERPFDEWNKTFLFFSGGDPTIAGQIDQLKNENDYILNSMVEPKPIGGVGYHFYKTINPSTNFGPYSLSAIQNAIDNGGLFISYIGHSGTQTWDNGITDVGDLKNSYNDRFPLISDFGCSTGKFAEPDVNCFGQLFISESNDGQAICYLSNSSWGYVSTAVNFPTYFYQQFLRDSVTNVGKAHVLAKIEQFQQNGYNYVNEVFAFCNVLFGDPLLDLKLPAKQNLEISAGDIKPENANPSDQDNNLGVKIYYHNYGLVPNDSIFITIKDQYNNKLETYIKIKVPIPLLVDSLNINIPIKNMVGLHNLMVILDSAGTVDEIYKNDNQASINFNVYSTNFRSLFNNKYYNSFNGTVHFLNPAYNTVASNSEFIFEIDTTQYFNSPVQFENNYGMFTSMIKLNNLLPDKRYWWRVKSLNSQLWSEPNSFLNIKSNYNWIIKKPMDSTADIRYSDTHFNSTDSSWELSSVKDELKISSAGSSDGKFASMQYNLLEELPSTYFWGVGTALIDTLTLKPYNFKTFVYPNPPAGDSLLNYLKSLPEGTVIAMAICDDGAQSVLGYNAGTPVRNEIKEFGSIYIDSIRYRESWCIIGKKGAAPGTVPEVYKKQFQGIAIIDTSIIVKSDSGSVLFPLITNSVRWDSLHVETEIPNGASLQIVPIGIKSNNSVDTLTSLNLVNGSCSLNKISASVYPGIKILAKFHSNQAKISPKIKELAVKLNSLPELGTNYQVVSISGDSVKQGEMENLQFYVYNAGESPADSFNVMVEVLKPDNTSEKIYESLVDSLNSGSRKLFNVSYSTVNGNGNRSFNISIDPGNKVSELYKDNNIFSIPFYIKPDSSRPTLNVTFDGQDILDGDYVSSHPKIRITLNDSSLVPLTDTSSISITLNDQPVYYLNSSASLTYQFNSSNPKMVVNYTPSLQDGEYTLQVIGKNTAGNSTEPVILTKNFIVQNEPHILYVYNYPNPFSGYTYFTFKLTQIPDELKIYIYTIAGRLIKIITKNSSQLKYDFNTIYWNGRDEDGDLLANGVYLYKIIMKKGNKTDNVIQKLAIVR